MPIFEFVCKKCGHQFEYMQFSSKEDDPECLKCKSKEVQKLMSAGNVRAHGIATGAGGFDLPKCAPSGGS